MLAHYLTLGLAPDAPQAEIRRRYLELTRSHPPSRDPDRFARIAAAYEALQDDRGARARRHVRDRGVQRLGTGAGRPGGGAHGGTQGARPAGAAGGGRSVAMSRSGSEPAAVTSVRLEPAEPEPDRSGAVPGERSGGDWKRQALAEFSQWLDELSGPPPAAEQEPDEGAAPSDLRDLFAELAALRQEVRLQNREQARAGRELAGAVARYDAVNAVLERRDEELAAFERRVARAAENRCLLRYSICATRWCAARRGGAAAQVRPQAQEGAAQGTQGGPQAGAPHAAGHRRRDRRLRAGDPALRPDVGAVWRARRAHGGGRVRCPYHARPGHAPGAAAGGGDRGGGIRQWFRARRRAAAPGRSGGGPRAGSGGRGKVRRGRIDGA